jgi:hypothetical protein
VRGCGLLTERRETRGDVGFSSLQLLGGTLPSKQEPLRVAASSGSVARREPGLGHSAPVGGEETRDGPTSTVHSCQEAGVPEV